MLGGKTLVARAVHVAREVCDVVVVSSDTTVRQQLDWGCGACRVRYLRRPEELAQDDTPMIAVVQDAMRDMPGEPDDVWLLVQCTQPFRKVEHLRNAVQLLRETQEDSVVSVVELPRSHSPEFVFHLDHGILTDAYQWPPLPRRQDAKPAYVRDGTVYAFWRRTVTEYDSIYGVNSRALVIPPEESCELDTEADWAEVERRWAARG